jgi:hypothetical protein
LILDSALDQIVRLGYWEARPPMTAPPGVMAKAFRIEGLTDGQWHPIATPTRNRHRHVIVPVAREVEALRFTLDATWGAERSRVYAFLVEGAD